jgi:uncharacterized repeat protein (TIGR03803 family)
MSKLSVAAFFALCGLAMGASGGAHADLPLQTVYSFCAQLGCTDGFNPNALVADSAGNLYGTARSGGRNNGGVAFELVFNGTGYDYRKLYDFCAIGFCQVGPNPTGTLVRDVNGNLYGTTFWGGRHGFGMAFELLPKAGGSSWKLVKLHNFCSAPDCADGKNPSAALSYQGAAAGVPYDGVSPLYGTTSLGGAHGGGVVFQLTPGSNKREKEKVLYAFCLLTACVDGRAPVADVIADTHGNLYGTTPVGGASNTGTVFELSPKLKRYRETVLHSFCSGVSCADGNTPDDGVIMDAAGDLVGAAQTSGLLGRGTLFKLTPNGASSPFAVLYNFCADTNCNDGQEPNGHLVLDADGDIFGTTAYGGDGSLGTLFELHGGTLSTLFQFCDCADGNTPMTGVFLDAGGDVFGTTSLGGAHDPNGGTVFKVMR